MNCCSDNPASQFFDKESKKFIKKYRKKGLEKISRMLVDAIEELGIKDATILDVGGGVGGAHRALLRNDASKAYATELSEEMINAAKVFSAEEGLTDKVEYILGDIVEMNGEIPEVDITMHDKVVCCYENAAGLFEKTLDKTKNIYGFVMPRNYPIARISFGLMIFITKLLRWDFHPYFHPEQPLLDKIENAGFKLKYENHTFIWKVRVYQKA